MVSEADGQTYSAHCILFCLGGTRQADAGPGPTACAEPPAPICTGTPAPDSLPPRPPARGLPHPPLQSAARRVGVLRGDHGCRLLPPVPTVTIESHGCPGDAGAGRAPLTAAPQLQSGRRRQDGGGGGRGRRARRGPGAGLHLGRAVSMWAGRPSRPLGNGYRRPEGSARLGSAPRTAAARAASPGRRGSWGPRGQGAAGGQVRGPGARPGVGGRDWRLLLRAARAVSSLEPRCRHTARAAVPPSLAAGGAAAPPPPRLPPFSAPARAGRHAALDVKAL